MTKLRQLAAPLLRPRSAATFTIATAALIAAADFVLPGDINAAIFYGLSVTMAGWTRSRPFLWITTAICALLSIGGLALGPQPAADIIGALYINRCFVVAVLLAIAGIVQQRMQMRHRLEAATILQAEQNEQLRDREVRLRATFDQVAVGIACTDLDGRFLQANDRLCAITGYSHAELLARGFHDITHPDDVEPNLRLRRALIAGEIPHFQLEKRYRRKDGSTYWVNLTVTLVRRASGEPDYAIGVIEDISARKRVEAEREQLVAQLAGERARFAMLLDHLPVGIAYMDRLGGILFTNPAFRRSVPGPVIPSANDKVAEEWIGYAPDGQRLDPSQYPAARALRGEVVSGIEFLRIRDEATGRPEYWLRIGALPVCDATGGMEGAVAVIVDIDREKRAEAALRRVNEELEQRVEQELGKRLAAEQSLQQAQKMEAIGQLTGGVAHDFNNILTTVIGNLELIAARSAADDPRRRLAENALRGAEQGARLTEHLLSFARRQRLEPEVLDVGGVLGAMLALARRAVGETIELSLDLQGKLWRCRVDQAQLQSAILNLVINARDAMPSGGRILIEAHNAVVSNQAPDIAAGDYVRLSVKDTGSGMAPEVVARAFEPFFTTKEAGRGSGLGLSMVYGFAKQSGGAVQIDSAVGRGTAVHLYLPRTMAPIDRATEPAAERLLPVPERPATVLVVEDEEGVRQLAAESLEELGYRVLRANDAHQALSVLESEAVDVVLSDVVMPGGMSGLALADEMRQRRKGLPVLLTTGYAEAIDRVEARGPGYEILRKPFRPRELGARIRRMLSAASEEDAPAGPARDLTAARDR